MEKIDEDSNQLPNEIICFEILPRLPRESLMHFRCVSKTWKALLTTNPGFQRIHRNFHPLNSGHLLLDAHVSGSGGTRKNYLLIVRVSQEGSAPSHVTDLVPLPCSFINLRYANGLVLGYSNLDLVYIFNPFTRESMTITPTIRFIDLYFGFSPSTNEYKVVATQNVAGLVEYKILTLGESSWRNIVVDWHHLSSYHPPPSDFRKNCVFVHGALHWLARSRETIILALDIGEEKLRIIPIPSQVGKMDKIIEVDGCLSIVCDIGYGVLWILKDYKHQVWVAETLKAGPSYPHYGHYRISRLPRCTTPTGELVFEVSSEDNHLQLYDMHSKIYRRSEIIFPKVLLDLGLKLDLFCASFDDSLAPL